MAYLKSKTYAKTVNAYKRKKKIEEKTFKKQETYR